jgi:hypothetical protein
MQFHRLALAATLAVSALAVPAAVAQPTPEQMKLIYDTSRNQQGVLEYCRAGGFVEADVLAIQTRVMAMMPAPADTSSGDAAYRTGKTGTVMAGDQSVTLGDAAKGQNTTEKALCERMGQAMKSAAAALPPG